MGHNEQYSKEVLICRLSLSFFLVTLLSHLITSSWLSGRGSYLWGWLYKIPSLRAWCSSPHPQWIYYQDDEERCHILELRCGVRGDCTWRQRLGTNGECGYGLLLLVCGLIDREVNRCVAEWCEWGSRPRRGQCHVGGCSGRWSSRVILKLFCL